ncbi:amidophosphoribosyltransferase [Elusimicrobiota bacterium]
MSGELKEECGVAAIVDLKPRENNKPFDLVSLLYTLLIKQQNRGHLAAGIATFNKSRTRILERYRALGTVNEAFRASDPKKFNALKEEFNGSVGIGHVRYGTFGKNDVECAQPFLRRHGKLSKKFAIAFNGNLANYAQLEAVLKREHDYSVESKTDTEIIMHNLALKIKSGARDWKEIFGHLADICDGAYNIVFLNGKGDLIISRDPYGFRPLCYGISPDKRIFAAASESVALERIGIRQFCDVEPGHLIHVHDGEVDIIKYTQPKAISHCMFEWIYFANICSVVNGRAVSDVRFRLGRELAKLEKEKLKKQGITVDKQFKESRVICCVPNSSIPVSEGFGFEMGLPNSAGLIKIDAAARTFISHKKDKSTQVKNKFDVNRAVLQDKIVYLIDDSIVRGNTSKAIVDYVKNIGGAKEVHVRAACPPVAYPCFYGIDMSTISELVAGKATLDNTPHDEMVKGISSFIGADSLAYQTFEGLIKGIGLSRKNLCMACLDGNYPTEHGRLLKEKAAANVSDKKETNRTYELV